MQNKVISVGFITSNIFFKKILDRLPSHVGFKLEEFKTDKKYDLLLIDFQTPLAHVNLKDYADTPNFSIYGSDQGFAENSTVKNCLKTYQTPLRLGQVMDDICYFSGQKTIKKFLEPVKIGTFEIDPQYYILTNISTGDVVQLTEKEQDILLYLHAQKDHFATRQDLLNKVWNYAEGVETHTLETHIYRLRQKIERDSATPSFLVTKDDGYFLNI